MNEMPLDVAWRNIQNCMTTKAGLSFDDVTILAVSRQVIGQHITALIKPEQPQLALQPQQ